MRLIMKTKYLAFSVAAAGLFYFASCITIVMPKTLTLTGKRTALEKQIIGDHKEIEARNLIGEYTSGAEDGKKKSALTEWDRKVLAARNRSRFNAPEIAEYKSRGWIGEGKDAQLKYITVKIVMTPAADNMPDSVNGKVETLTEKELKRRDPIHVRIAQKLVNTENANRQIFIEDIIDKDPKLTDADRQILVLKVAEQYRAKLKKGEWYQDAAGAWTVKGRVITGTQTETPGKATTVKPAK